MAKSLWCRLGWHKWARRNVDGGGQYLVCVRCGKEDHGTVRRSTCAAVSTCRPSTSTADPARWPATSTAAVASPTPANRRPCLRYPPSPAADHFSVTLIVASPWFLAKNHQFTSPENLHTEFQGHLLRRQPRPQRLRHLLGRPATASSRP